MDDLAGLGWSSSSAEAKPASAKPDLAAQSAATASSNGGAFSSLSSLASYPSLRPTPPPAGAGSGRSTPLSALSAHGSGASRPAATSAAQDSFSSLISFSSSSKATANLSLREHQERLDAERRRKAEAQRKQQQANYGNGLDMLGRGVAMGTSRTGSPALAPPPTGSGDDDLFAAFNADTKVDQASHFPPPPALASQSGKSTPAAAPSPLDLSNPSAWGKPSQPSSLSSAAQPAAALAAADGDDDDDPFGLSQLVNRAAPAAAAAGQGSSGNDANDANDDDDFLGDLGKPVEEVRRKTEAQRRQEAEQQRRQQRPPEPGKPIEDSDSDSDAAPEPRQGTGHVARTGNPQFDHAVAQLVDYGFSPEDARRGLTESGRGFDVQAAVNFLLDDAHRQAKEKARAKQGGGGRGGDPFGTADEGARMPARGSSRSPADGPGTDDFAKTAAAVGTNLLKTANSLWRTGQKQLQKAVQEFQQQDSGDLSQPKWMRPGGQDRQGPPAARDNEGEGDTRRRRTAAAATVAAAAAAATDEALMLESGARPERRQQHSGLRPAAAEPLPASRTQSPASGPPSRNSPVPRWQQGAGAGAGGGAFADPRARLTKQAVEEASAQVYVSPARRRKAAAPAAPAATEAAAAPAQAATAASEQHPTGKPAAGVVEGDLLSNSTALPQRPAQRPVQQQAGQRPLPRATPSPRPAAARNVVARQVPAVNAFVLKASAKHRADGAAHVKRGDYAAAHASYSASLVDIPGTHPLLAVLFCNRALTALKTGDPRQAVADADAALAIIGPGKGEGETVALEDGTGATRDLRDLYGKAMTRKAEALEQMEKWAEAGQVWQQCVEGGVGGATATAGRQRCQTALKPKPKPKPKPPVAVARAPTRSTAGGGPAAPVTAASGRDFEAVQRLRAANEAVAREDAEKRALTDQVEARVAAWRDGKKENLRALLGSLDRVLWAGSGWKTVGLHELVMPNKVKVVYMRAIAKTHPDKLPPDASTEVRMIAGTVFATLNESWDRFKAENKM